MQPVLVGSTAASQLTTEPIATGVGGVNRRGRRSRHERSVLVGSTTSDGANNEQSVLVGLNAVVDGADNEQSVLSRALRKSEGWCYLRLGRGERLCTVSDPLAESDHQLEKTQFI